MARIRSVKPEFFSDPKVLSLRDGTALFYIALWTACDDQGYFEIDSKSLAVKTARWRPQEVAKHLRRLHEEGMVKLSSGNGAGMVSTWSRHQRVMKPQRSKWEDKQIQWDNAPSPRNGIGGIGREGIGEDRKGREIAAESPTSATTQGVSVPKKPRSDPEKNRPTWTAYSDAYRARYGEPPVRNQSVNIKIAEFVSRLGAEESPLVAAFYVTHNDSFYVKNMHAVGLMLKDAEKLRTEWKTNRKVTNVGARNEEKTAHWEDQAKRIQAGEL